MTGTPRPVLLALLLAVVSALALPAVARADSGTPPGAAWVRIGHFVPGLGSTRIDLVPSSGRTTSIEMSPSAAYGDVTAYRKVVPGRYTVQVRSTTGAGSAAPMLSRSFTVKAGQACTLAVLGQDSAPRLVALVDDLTPPRAGDARVRLLSASATAPTVSVSAVGGPTIATGTVLGQTTGYASVPDGEWTLRLSGGAATSEQRVDLASGSVYTAVALDRPGKRVRIKVVTDAAGAAATPKGGARTGGGGTAPTDLPAYPLGAVTLAGLALVVAVAARRRGAHAR